MYAIGKVLIDVIVVLFFVGMAGSAVVIFISFIEDFRELFGDDETPEMEPKHAPPAPDIAADLHRFASKQRAR
jgi:hypothetical protein